jgi:tetratricopeptide (TPR) repeat protein
MRAMLLVSIFCAVSPSLPVQAQQARTPALREAEDLQTMVRDPRHLVAVTLGEGAPFQEHRDLFDQAFDACRRALRVTSNDNVVRTNLGGLYLWRNALHPDESGNFQKAIDQFLIVLNNEPGNVTVLEYFGTYEVLIRVRPELGEQGMANIESAIQRTLTDSAGAANLRAFARVLLFDNRLSEARTAAQALTALAPESASFLSLGSAELRMAHADKALAAFQVALQRAHDAVETSTAKLGSAQANQALGNTREADHLLEESVAALPPQTLERAARAAGLDTPNQLGWAIGKAYMASGEMGKAAARLGSDGMVYLSSEMARKSNSEGVRLFDNDDWTASRSAFVAAARLLPLEPVYWENAGMASFRMGLFQESLIALGKASALAPLGSGNAFRLGISYAVLGDYRNGQVIFEKAAMEFPQEPLHVELAVALAYASGGWDSAMAAWSRLRRNGGDVSRADLFDIFVRVRDGMSGIVERSERRRALYLSLRHQSVLHHILGEGLKRELLSPDSREMIKRERQQSMNMIIDHYRRLPLKPVLTPEVQELVLRAEVYMGSALQNYDTRSKAAELYRQAIEAAPWWPEGHYTLALLACQNPGDSFAREAEPKISTEKSTYLALAPDGPDAAHARKILERCYP